MSRAQIVCFLQNQWFPAKSHRAVLSCYGRHGGTPEGRANVNMRYLFYKCKTGQVLRRCWPEDLIEKCVWENCTREIGSEAASKLPPDRMHIVGVLDHFKPDVVVAFGDVAQKALEFVGVELVHAPHPAARQGDVAQRLRAIGELLCART